MKYSNTIRYDRNQSNWSRDVIIRKEQTRYDNTMAYRSRGYVSATSSSTARRVSATSSSTARRQHTRTSLSYKWFSLLAAAMKKRIEERADARRQIRQAKENAPYSKIRRVAKRDIALGIVGIIICVPVFLLIETGLVSVVGIAIGFVYAAAGFAGMLLTDGISSLLAIRKGKISGVVKEIHYIRFFISLFIVACCMGILLL